MSTSTGKLRALTWNILNGGIDGDGSTDRLLQQWSLLRQYHPDILCVPEATHWHDNNNDALDKTADALGLTVAKMARSHVGNGTNNTALLYNSHSLDLVGEAAVRGEGAFHHALIRAQFRPKWAPDGSRDFLALATHLSPSHGDARLDEIRMWLTDHGGEFPGMPNRAILLGDLNTPDREPKSWDDVPRNLWARYRHWIRGQGFGGADMDALKMLLESGWQDPYDLLGRERPPTVGWYYPNELVPWALDYILVNALDVVDAFTHPWDPKFRLSDHLPVGLDFRVA